MSSSSSSSSPSLPPASVSIDGIPGQPLSVDASHVHYSSSSIPLVEVLSVSSVEGVLQVECVGRECGGVWRLLSFSFLFADISLLPAYTQHLNALLPGPRPRSLLVFVNPAGGTGDAVRIWNEMSPVFSHCSISVHVVMTERAGQATDTLLSMDAAELNLFDGIVAVGGDGLFNEIVCGAVRRQQRDDGVDVDDMNVQHLDTPRWRLALIPAGSSNATTMSIHGNDDPLTAALHIILGDDCGVDACTVHDGPRLLRVAANAIIYAWMGELLQDSERYRSLGPLRYQWAGVRTVLKNPTFSGLVAFQLASTFDENGLPVASAFQQPECSEECEICSGMIGKEALSMFVGAAPIYPFHMRAEWSHIICCVIPCVSPSSPKGLAPFTGVGDGSMDLTLIPKLSRIGNIGFIIDVSMNGGKNLHDDPRCKVFRISRFTFTPASQLARPKEKDEQAAIDDVEEGVWNVDGEIIQQPKSTLHFRLHPRLFRYFGREKEDPARHDEKDRKLCFNKISKCLSPPHPSTD